MSVVSYRSALTIALLLAASTLGPAVWAARDAEAAPGVPGTPVMLVFPPGAPAVAGADQAEPGAPSETMALGLPTQRLFPPNADAPPGTEPPDRNEQPGPIVNPEPQAGDDAPPPLRAHSPQGTDLSYPASVAEWFPDLLPAEPAPSTPIDARDEPPAKPEPEPRVDAGAAQFDAAPGDADPALEHPKEIEPEIDLQRETAGARPERRPGERADSDAEATAPPAIEEASRALQRQLALTEEETRPEPASDGLLHLTIEEAVRELEDALREQHDEPSDSGAVGEAPRLLPTDPAGPAPRSRHLELIAREADAHTRRGFELAGLRAYFSARAEFVKALRRVSQGLDTERQTRTHSRALAAGWTALKEADDFLPQGSRLEAELDLPGIIRAHRTPVLKHARDESLAPLTGLQCYLTYAQEQLATAVGEEVAGSMALHGLGNLYRRLAAKGRSTNSAATSKAMVFYQAALLAAPGNYMASNELGVLLARAGRYHEARSALEHSVSIVGLAEGLYNLSVVYHELGHAERARQAYEQCQAAHRAQAQQQAGRSSPVGSNVEWVGPEVFARRLRAPGAVGPTASRPGNSTSWNAPATLPMPAARRGSPSIVLCQALGPAAPCPVCAVDCACCDWSRRGGWERARAIAWQAYAQGEYVGHARTAHVPEYRLRVDDVLDLVYRLTREETAEPYRLNVGDEVRVESFTDEELTRDLIIQPDGTITLRLLGQVRATGHTVAQLREELEEMYKQYYPVPAITVTPLKVNTKLEDLRAVVDSRYGRGGQSREARVTPEGTIALPVIGSVQAQGLTLPELQQELNECYREHIEGIEVIPVLVQRAPRYVYVLGEVRTPGRFELTGPTTVLQALSMAGSWNVGAHLKQIVIFRRGDDWRLMATMVDLQATLHGKKACPAGELWLSDSDVIIVPKSPILRTADFIDLVFTRGIYGVFPVQAAVNFSKLSTL